MSGAGLTAHVTGNTVTGAGPTDQIAQNGIQFSLGATGTIAGNTVSGHRYTGPSYTTAAGILLSGVDDVTLTDNIVTEGQTGIYAYQADGLTIQGGAVREQTWAIILWEAAGGLGERRHHQQQQ